MNLASLIESHGPEGFYRQVCSLLNDGQLTVDDFSYRQLAEACGVLSQMDTLRDSLHTASHDGSPEAPPHALLRESAPGVGTSLFRVVTGELIGRKVIEGYEDESGFIGDQLVTVLPSRLRGQKLAGFRALAGPTEVAEGQPYEESDFAEKYVTTAEAKQGRILSINEELIQFDQTGEINRRAMGLGHQLRLERERTIVRAVVDGEWATGTAVYRPAGQAAELYADDGQHRNLIGPGNTTSPDFAETLPLADAEAIDRALHYRATQVRDDRTDGQPRPIVAPARQLLVPEAQRSRATAIVQASEVVRTTDTMQTRLANPLRGRLDVLASPFLDELAEEAGSPVAAADWFLGDFRRQFLWTEIWPVQTFLQRADSAAAFDRDVVLRVKARYFGGVSAVDTAYVTKVQG